MVEVVHRTAEGLGVLIFSQTRKHAREIADALPPGSWAIVTDDTPESQRADILARARSGELKSTINLALLSTGIDVSYWQYIVYLRPVGSLVLLIQSIGRVLRLHIESGADMNSISREERLNEIACSRKPNAMVFDYAGVMDKLGPLYENPILAQAQLEKAKREGSVIYCPKCNEENSDKARRCIGVSGAGVRCDWFWIKQDCRKCGAHNDVTARDCRVCGGAAGSERQTPTQSLHRPRASRGREMGITTRRRTAGFWSATSLKATSLITAGRLSSTHHVAVRRPNASGITTS